MASTSRATTILLALLFLLTFSHARHVTDPFPKPEREPEIRTSKSKPRQPDTVSFTLDSVDPVPFTLPTLRPIARHLPPRHQLPLPLSLPSSLHFGHRRCRHGHRREISYGDDAIVRSSGVAAVDRLIPARWIRIRHGQPRISEIPRFYRHLDRDRDHDHDHDHHHHHHHGEEEKKKKDDEGWFVKKIRNFFNLF